MDGGDGDTWNESVVVIMWERKDQRFLCGAAWKFCILVTNTGLRGQNQIKQLIDPKGK